MSKSVTKSGTNTHTHPQNPWDAFVAMKAYYKTHHTDEEAKVATDVCDMLMAVLCISESGGGVGITSAYFEEFGRFETNLG